MTKDPIKPENNPIKLQPDEAVVASVPKEAFKAINDTLLDGMPCDHVNEIKEQDEEHVQWVRTTDIHKPYWDEVGGDSNHYHLLREAYIKGMLKESDYGYGKAEENLFEIRRENKK